MDSFSIYLRSPTRRYNCHTMRYNTNSHGSPALVSTVNNVYTYGAYYIICVESQPIHSRTHTHSASARSHTHADNAYGGRRNEWTRPEKKQQKRISNVFDFSLDRDQFKELCTLEPHTSRSNAHTHSHSHIGQDCVRVCVRMWVSELGTVNWASTACRDHKWWWTHLEISTFRTSKNCTDFFLSRRNQRGKY